MVLSTVVAGGGGGVVEDSGVGAPAAKSAELLSLSAPAALRATELVLVGAADLAVS